MTSSSVAHNERILALFTAWLVSDGTISGRTAINYVSRISAIHARVLNVTCRVPKGSSSFLKTVLTDLDAKFPASTDKKQAFSMADIRDMTDMAAALTESWGRVVSAAIVVMYSGGFRASEVLDSPVAATNMLRRSGVTFHPSFEHCEFAMLHLPRTKTSRTPPPPVVLGAIDDDKYCPVRALKRMFGDDRYSQNDGVFMLSPRRTLSARHMNAFIQSWARARRRTTAGATCHAAFRYSCLTNLIIGGVPLEHARRHLRWTPDSTAPERYFVGRVSLLSGLTHVLFGGHGAAATPTRRAIRSAITQL